MSESLWNDIDERLRSQLDAYMGRSERRRKLHKAFLRYHDAANWPALREALKAMGRADLIGNAKWQLVPSYQPAGTAPAAASKPWGAKGAAPAPTTAPRRGAILTQHTGLPPKPKGAGAKRKASR